MKGNTDTERRATGPGAAGAVARPPQISNFSGGAGSPSDRAFSGVSPETNGLPRRLDASPSMGDGFGGAQDAALLERYDHDEEISCVHVQATFGTRKLLRRAGFSRTYLNRFYAVPVVRDGFGRLQIAPGGRGAHA